MANASRLCQYVNGYDDERDASSSSMGGVLGSVIIYVSSLSFCLCYDVILYICISSIFFRSVVYVLVSSMFTYIRFLSRSLYIDRICSLSYSLVTSSFFYHLLVKSLSFRTLGYIYPLIKTIKIYVYM